MIKLLLKILPYQVFASIYFYLTSWKKNVFLNKNRRQGLYKTLDMIDLKKYKKSEKLFILGSGFSLNSITANQWKEINDNDSFGFNFSLLNKDHIPTFYTCEALMPVNLNEKGMSYMANLYNASFATRNEDYKNVIKFVSDLNENNVKHFANYGKEIIDENFYIVNTVNGVAGNRKQFHQLINYYKSKGIFDESTYLDKLFKFRATLCLGISFGIRMGYKKIILCGIDLNDPRYFFEDVNKYPNSIRLESNPNNKSHSTITPNQLFVSIDKVVKELNENICIPGGIELTVQNPNSVLSSIIKVYKFDEI